MAQAATNTQSSSADRPERSRNAKAQARHRAKRKAYIEQVHTYRRPVWLFSLSVLTVYTFFFFFLYVHSCSRNIARANRNQASDSSCALARTSRGPAATNAAHPPARTRKLQAHAGERRASSPAAHADPTAVSHDRPTFRHCASWLVPVYHV